MSDPALLLKADHRTVKDLLTELAESDAGIKRRRLLDKLRTELEVHMQLEESLVYPLVREHIGEEEEEEADVEHGLAREGLSKLAGLVDGPGFGAAVEMLEGGISHHVKEEEKEILPQLKRQLPREEWLGLGKELQKGKGAAVRQVRAARKSAAAL
jgi:hemerythrin-like domain-containing protein